MQGRSLSHLYSSEGGVISLHGEVTLMACCGLGCFVAVSGRLLAEAGDK